MGFFYPPHCVFSHLVTESGAVNIGHIGSGLTGGTKDGAVGLQATAAVSRESPLQWLGLYTHTQIHTHTGTK